MGTLTREGLMKNMTNWVKLLSTKKSPLKTLLETITLMVIQNKCHFIIKQLSLEYH